jgi:hypothetical protein
LQDLGALLEKGDNVHEFGKLIKVAKAVAGGPASGFAGYGASAVLGRIMTDPEFAAKAVKALQTGRKVAPAVAATSIARQRQRRSVESSAAQQ